ncbi:MAG: UDP-3-O-(3-hydroxymyristoyl)glucosamine N-acyltransferase [Bacteroidaceae bacterium]|nr:UDP-3-O-(3-hydroxymyristoyl)glucosamine N-acyltransferase [Bacteroidaceae bacterium]
MEFKAQQIAEYLGGTIEGNPEVSICTFAKIEEGVPGALSFYYDPKFEPYLYQTQSSVVLVPTTFQAAQPVQPTLIRVDDPRMAIGRLLSLHESMKPKRTGIDPKACVAATAKIGKDVYIGPFAVVEDNAEIGDGTQLHPHVVIGEGARIGNNCTLYPNVTVYHDCLVGNRCILHAGAVIGADGFGFSPTAEGNEKIPQIGIAVIEDDVEIGANSCVDRAMMGTTNVRKDVKIDNLVQVGHNSEIGAHTVLCGQVGVAGSTKVGEWCIMTGQVGIAGHLTVADRTIAAAQAGIATSIRKPGQTIMGYPAYDAKACSRSYIVFKSLPEMAVQLRQLQKEVEQLKSLTPTPSAEGEGSK